MPSRRRGEGGGERTVVPPRAFEGLPVRNGVVVRLRSGLRRRDGQGVRGRGAKRRAGRRSQRHDNRLRGFRKAIIRKRNGNRTRGLPRRDRQWRGRNLVVRASEGRTAQREGNRYRRGGRLRKDHGDGNRSRILLDRLRRARKRGSRQRRRRSFRGRDGQGVRGRGAKRRAGRRSQRHDNRLRGFRKAIIRKRNGNRTRGLPRRDRQWRGRNLVVRASEGRTAQREGNRYRRGGRLRKDHGDGNRSRILLDRLRRARKRGSRQRRRRSFRGRDGHRVNPRCPHVGVGRPVFDGRDDGLSRSPFEEREGDGRFGRPGGNRHGCLVHRVVEIVRRRPFEQKADGRGGSGHLRETGDEGRRRTRDGILGLGGEADRRLVRPVVVGDRDRQLRCRTRDSMRRRAHRQNQGFRDLEERVVDKGDVERRRRGAGRNDNRGRHRRIIHAGDRRSAQSQRHSDILGGGRRELHGHRRLPRPFTDALRQRRKIDDHRSCRGVHTVDRSAFVADAVLRSHAEIEGVADLLQ